MHCFFLKAILNFRTSCFKSLKRYGRFNITLRYNFHSSFMKTTQADSTFSQNITPTTINLHSKLRSAFLYFCGKTRQRFLKEMQGVDQREQPVPIISGACIDQETKPQFSGKYKTALNFLLTSLLFSGVFMRSAKSFGWFFLLQDKNEQE